MGVAAPLIHSSLTLRNIVQDSLIQEDKDGKLSLVFENELFNYSVDELFSIPQLDFTKLFTVDSLRLSNTNIQHEVTLGRIARGIGGLEGLLLLSSHEKTANIDTITELSTQAIDIDAAEYFKSADLISGTMEVSIANDLPIDIENVAYEFRNKASQTIIARDTFASIPSGTFATQTFDLAGQQLEGQLEVEMTNFDSPGSRGNEVMIDTNDAVNIGVRLYGIGVNSATAVFPAQYLINDTNDVTVEGLKQELREMTIEEGIFSVDIANTAQDTIYIFYDFPAVTKDGQSLQANIVLPPPATGGVITYNYVTDINGYHFDLTGSNQDTFNTFGSIFTARIDSTGREIHLTKADSFFMSLSFQKITPKIAHGYLGRDTIAGGNNNSDFEVFQKVTAGNIAFEDLSVELNIHNSLGVDGGIKVNNIAAEGGFKDLKLLSNEFNDMIRINRATYPPLQATNTSITLNNQNSNIIGVINSNPRQLISNVSLFINPDSAKSEDFILFESEVKGDLTIELPLSFSANNLSFRDTLDLDFSEIENSQRILNGTLRLQVDNQFPIDAQLQLSLLDDSKELIQTVPVSGQIEAGIIKDGKVDNPNQSIVEIPLDVASTINLFEAKHMLLNVSFNSVPNDEFIQLFSSYQFNVSIIGEFNYRNE